MFPSRFARRFDVYLRRALRGLIVPSAALRVDPCPAQVQRPRRAEHALIDVAQERVFRIAHARQHQILQHARVGGTAFGKLLESRQHAGV